MIICGICGKPYIWNHMDEIPDPNCYCNPIKPVVKEMVGEIKNGL